MCICTRLVFIIRPFTAYRSQPVSRRFRRCPHRYLLQEGVVHLNEGTPARVVDLLRSVPEHAHVALGRGHDRAASPVG